MKVSWHSQAVSYVLLILWFSLANCSEPINYQKMETPEHLLHTFELNPKQLEIQLIQGNQSSNKPSTLYHMAQEHNAILAINGGYWSLNQKHQTQPVGNLKINNQWISSSKTPRGIIGWSQEITLFDNLVVNSETQRLKPKFHSEATWQKTQYALGAGPLLVANGKIIRDYGLEDMSNQHFINDPHARTAIGLKTNGNWYIVIVEQKYTIRPEVFDIHHLGKFLSQQRQNIEAYIKQHSKISLKGMTIPELANFMKTQGCKWALNLDGGSSTAVYYNGEILNHILQDEYLESKLLLRQINNAIIFK